MKRVFTLLAALLLTCGLSWAQNRAEEVLATCLFGANYNQQSVGSYTATWTTTNGDYSWTVVNGNNNNNNWDYVKFGRKNNASVGTITTSEAYDDAISKVELTIDAITASSVNSIKLYTSEDNSEWDEVGSFTKAAGTQTVTLADPADNLYYKVEFDCASGAANGLVTVSKVEYYYNTGGANSPTITADNVEIAYDAQGGEIAYTINNPVTGTVLSATTESDWLGNLQVGTSSVTFSCDPNQVASPRTATVTLTYGTVTKNVTITQAGNPDAVNTISDIIATGSYVVEGTIVAMSNRGFVLGDGTGYVYYYDADFSSNYGIGDIVKISGAIKVYGGVYEFDKNASIEEGDDSSYDEEEPLVLSGEDMDARVASTTPPDLSTYVQYVGTLAINTSGTTTHYNITDIEGATTAIGSLSYPTNTDELTELDGKQVIVTGYYVGISTGTYYNTMVESVEELVTDDPYITIPATASFEYGGGYLEEEITYGNYQGTPELDVVYCDANGDPVTAEPDWMSANAQYHDSENGEWYMLEINCGDNGGAVRTAYLKVTDGTVSSNVMTITQEANPDIIMTIAEVRAAEVGTTVKTQGLITSCVGTTAYMQDDEAAICVYGTELVVGYEYTVEGTLTLYKGLLEITDPTCQMVTEGNDVIPEVMTIAFINADYASDNAYQGWLVKIEEATVTAINSQNVTIEQIDAASAEPATITVRFASANDITFAVNDIITLTGNIGCFNGVQIANPRDIEVQENTNPSITLTSESEVFMEWNNIDCTLIEFEIENPVEGVELDATADVDWIEIGVIEENSLCFVLTENTGNANRVGIITLSYEGAEDVTVTVTQGYEIVPGDWELVELEDLEEGDVFVIVGTTADGGTYAMANDNGTSAPAAVAVTIAENTLAGEIAENLQWNISGTSDGYTFYPNGTTEEWLYCINNNNGLRVGTGENNLFTYISGGVVDDVEQANYLFNNGQERYVGIYVTNPDWRSYSSVNNNIKNQSFAFYKKTGNIIDVVDELIVEVPEENDIYIVHDGAVLTLTGEVPDTWDESHIIVEDGGELFHDAAVPATLKKDIVGYNGKGVTGYYLVSAPVYTTSDYTYPVPESMITAIGGAEFDLYMFDESQDEEWLNYKDPSAPFNNTLKVGVGYLFSRSVPSMITMLGTTVPTSTFNVTLQKTDGAEFSGLNLVGNPFTATAYLADGREFYVLNSDGELTKSTVTNIAPLNGVFVAANSNNETLVFSTVPPIKRGALDINVSQNNELVDVASVNFESANRLEKFQLNPYHTKVFFTEAGKDFASINANNSDDMALNFKAEYDGTYTINVNAKDIEMGYLHLIDNMTGADIDLLANPSYSFNAKVSDYASRFRLVFSANGESNDANFAFMSNGNLIVNGQGTLQVIDMTGRVVSTETIDGVSSIEMSTATGVYVVRLTNGNNVKTQKIVVK